VSEVPETLLIRVSAPVKQRLEEIRRGMAADLGRKSVTMSEVLEQLLADQWSPKP
jgi:hypothetical protein